jgi:Cdc6-like AAA superfamily ATPase
VLDDGDILSVPHLSHLLTSIPIEQSMANKVVFTTYGKNDLIGIVESRIGRSIVDPKMVEYVASKVAATSGDARKFIDLVSRAVEVCREKLPNNILNSKLEKPVVKLPHAMMIIRQTNTKYKDLIESLPNYEKYTLCVGVQLSRTLGSTPLTLAVLKKFSMQAFGLDKGLDSCISLEDFKGIVERLVDTGLLRMADDEKRKLSSEPLGNLLSFPIRFDLQLEDVESALEETLLKEDFYKRMVERTKSIRVDLNSV